MKQFNYQKGKRGEEIARVFLEKKGYVMAEMNYQNRMGEIDLIMTDGDSLVFVEVKLKVGMRFGSPQDMINKKKLWKIRRMAEAYLMFELKIAKKYEKYRIDAVCIVLDESKEVEKITHYENIGT
ncbi:YraN family protein [Patescibacteria group bacterium]|nr:YraN family protein [Patescibacteria group bacterium]